VATGVKKHSQKYHKCIPIKVRKRIVEFVVEFDTKKPEEVEVPIVEVAAIEGLNVVKGFQCEECYMLYRLVCSMEEYYKT
jgi:hypothetical protein